MPQQSAGLLLHRVRNGRRQVLLVHPGGPFWQKKDEGAWSIPKGELTENEVAAFRPVLQPLVRRHPVTGRKSLFPSSHAGAILGWSIPEARMLLRDLMEHATQRQFVYSHVWRLHDLVMWDNRSTMHRARRFDRNEVRDVRRTTLAGDGLTMKQLS